MGTILKFPPRIVHLGGRPEQEGQNQIIDRVLLNLRLPKAACKLMRYYASQGQGFRPSLKVINEATNVGEKNVSAIRQYLVNHGLIGYDGDTITIHWFRLRSLAAMEPKKMGQKKDWKVSPLAPDLLGDTKTQVHNYIGTRDSESRKLLAAYESTAQAILDGVSFPELGTGECKIDPNLLGPTKTQVHNYIGDGDFAAWYNPFNEPDPQWVYQVPLLDAYGQIVAYAHYNVHLPF